MKNNFLNTIFTALTGIGTAEVVETASAINPTPIQEGATLLTQLVILVVAIINLFKRKKND